MPDLIQTIDHLKNRTRRYFLQECWSGIGAVAFAALMNDGLFAAVRDPMAPKMPHYPAKAKRVIFLGMSGGPSQLELFDYKPKLIELHGQPVPKSVVGEQRYAFIKPDSPLRGTERKFRRHGQCGMEISELLPNIGSVADEICLVRSMVTDVFNHAPAQLFLHTGSERPGAWAVRPRICLVLQCFTRTAVVGIREFKPEPPAGPADFYLRPTKVWCCVTPAIPFSTYRTLKVLTERCKERLSTLSISSINTVSARWVIQRLRLG